MRLPYRHRWWWQAGVFYRLGRIFCDPTRGFEPKVMVLAFILFLGWHSGARAAEQRTLQELTELALKTGKDEKIDPYTSRNLGFPKKELPVKQLRYSPEHSPDVREHTFNLVYKKKGDELKPVAVIWTIDKTTVTASGRSIVGVGLRISLKGRLQEAMRISGIVGDLRQVKVPLKNVRDDFQSEQTFWTKDSLPLQLDK